MNFSPSPILLMLGFKILSLLIMEPAPGVNELEGDFEFLLMNSSLIRLVAGLLY